MIERFYFTPQGSWNTHPSLSLHTFDTKWDLIRYCIFYYICYLAYMSLFGSTSYNSSCIDKFLDSTGHIDTCSSTRCVHHIRPANIGIGDQLWLYGLKEHSTCQEAPYLLNYVNSEFVANFVYGHIENVVYLIILLYKTCFLLYSAVKWIDYVTLAYFTFERIYC